MKVPLFTSLPPNLSRRDVNGKEIGAEYQDRCIESWHRAGFEPISVNSKSEPFPHSLGMVSVGRDASAMTGRPNIFLADLLTVASQEAGGGPVVVMNADLLIRPDTDLAAALRKLSPGEFIFGRRINIDRLDETSGLPFLSGYDFFGGYADDIAAVPDGGMVFGAPWWDFYLPLMMFGQGCSIYQTEPAVLHLAHEIRWLQAWEALGHRFIVETQTRVADESYRSRLDDAMKGRSGQLLSDLKRFVWKRLPKNAAFDRRQMLIRVAVAGRSFLDEVAAPRSVMAQP
jgi:hypothetical protein